MAQAPKCRQCGKAHWSGERCGVGDRPAAQVHVERPTMKAPPDRFKVMEDAIEVLTTRIAIVEAELVSLRVGVPSATANASPASDATKPAKQDRKAYMRAYMANKRASSPDPMR